MNSIPSKTKQPNSQAASAPIFYSLPSSITIDTAESIAQELKALTLAEKSGLQLDASNVESITTPGLQIIVSMEKALLALGGSLSITGKQDSFVQVFREAGLERLVK